MGHESLCSGSKTHLVNGNLGYEAQLVNAVIISRAPIIGRPEYEWYGDWSKVDGKSCKDSSIGVRISIQIKGQEKKLFTMFLLLKLELFAIHQTGLMIQSSKSRILQ